MGEQEAQQGAHAREAQDHPEVVVHRRIKSGGAIADQKKMSEECSAHHAGERKLEKRQTTPLPVFVDATLPMFAQLQIDIPAQVNECFHPMRAKKASKQQSWKDSLEARTSVTVLGVNEGPG
jgi:hypothetical protein